MVTVSAMDWICVLDMASLRLTRGDGVAVARSAASETLARVDIDASSDERDTAFALYEAILAGAVVTRTGPDGSLIACPVALYNPYSGQVSVEALPRTRVYSLGERAFPSEGLLVQMHTGALVDDEKIIPVVEASVSSVAAACGAHPDPD